MRPEHIDLLPPPLSEAATAVAEARERREALDDVVRISEELGLYEETHYRDLKDAARDLLEELRGYYYYEEDAEYWKINRLRRLSGMPELFPKCCRAEAEVDEAEGKEVPPHGEYHARLHGEVVGLGWPVDADELRRRIEAKMSEVRGAKRNHRFGTPGYSPMVLNCLDNRVFGYEDVLAMLDEMEGR